VPTPQPQVQPAPRAGTITVPKKTQPVSAKRLASVATLACPAGATCTVKAPARVKVTIAGARHALTVLAPKTIKAGRTATVRVRLSKAAYTRLAGRSTRVKLTLTITANGTRMSRAVQITLKRKAAVKRAG
jgi:hypothetical protein